MRVRSRWGRRARGDQPASARAELLIWFHLHCLKGPAALSFDTIRPVPMMSSARGNGLRFKGFVSAADAPSDEIADTQGCNRMIVFGWGRRTRKDNGPAVLVTCSRCSNPAAYRWISTKTWFSLFFVPLIPYSSKHFLVCPICSNSRVLSAQDVQHVTALIPHTAQALAGEGDPDAYVRETAAFWQRLSGAVPPGAITAPPTRAASWDDRTV